MASSDDTNGHSEATTEGASDLEKKIIKQVEFYFGDRNFSRDKFLKEKAEEDEGWVTLECLVTFNRLKSLSTDTDAIATALKKSDTGLIEVSEDNKKVRRQECHTLPENTAETRQEANTRAVYCKGFPSDSSLDQLEEFFADKGKVILISMRRDFNRAFKGSVFVEFGSVEEAKAFVALESVKYNDEELFKMMKLDYFNRKTEKYLRHKAEKKECKVKQEQKGEEGNEEEKDKVEEEEEKEEEQKPPKYESGCVLHFTNVGEQTSREDLKTLFGEHEDISWVDFERGCTEGFVRFSKEGGAQRVVETLKAKNDGKVVIREAEATLRVLEGEEEKKHWIKAHMDREKARQRKAKKFRGGRGGRFGGWRGRGGKRSFERPVKKEEGTDDETQKRTHTQFDDDEPSPKKPKTEENSQ